MSDLYRASVTSWEFCEIPATENGQALNMPACVITEIWDVQKACVLDLLQLNTFTHFQLAHSEPEVF